MAHEKRARLAPIWSRRPPFGAVCMEVSDMRSSWAATRPSLSPGAALFLRHALRLEDPATRSEAFEIRAERLSDLLKLLQGDLDDLTKVELERLREALAGARTLARATRLDPRRPRLKLSGDPARELAELLLSLHERPVAA